MGGLLLFYPHSWVFSATRYDVAVSENGGDVGPVPPSSSLGV